jgi:membrane-associated protease RseP (regulator of RpoE activity)
MTTLGILIFIVAILFSIGFHEFGHFITAKRFGIKVEQFFIGFGPRLWSVRKGETEYGVKALPVGGYVRIAGMNPFEEIPPEDAGRVFKAKKPWQRAIVLAAGSFTHFLLAFVVIALVLGFAGEKDIDRPTTRLSAVEATLEGKPTAAAAAGIKPGDVMVAINGHRIRAWSDVQKILKQLGGKRVSITVRRNGKLIETKTTLGDHKPDGTKAGFLGVMPDFQVVKPGFIGAITQSGDRLGNGIVQSFVGIKDIFSPRSIGHLFNVAQGRAQRKATDPASVVGITRQAGDLAKAGDFRTILFFIAGFNIFIGVANLLPLPPLDGGHLAVLTYEKIRRREVDMRKLIPITATVISVFGSLFLLLLYLDIVRPLPTIPG